MKKLLLFIVLSPFSLSVLADDSGFDVEKFVTEYLAARTATQQPDATNEDLEHYLSFLVEDVGYQHLPYNDDDSRCPAGKSDMREGMTFYLGNNKSFTAELVNFTSGFNVVAIQYKGVHKYQREGEPLTVENYLALDVLELDNGKVTVIRDLVRSSREPGSGTNTDSQCVSMSRGQLR